MWMSFSSFSVSLQLTFSPFPAPTFELLAFRRKLTNWTNVPSPILLPPEESKILTRLSRLVFRPFLRSLSSAVFCNPLKSSSIMAIGLPVTQKLFLAWFSSTLAVSSPPLPSGVHWASISSPVDLIVSKGSLQPGLKSTAAAARAAGAAGAVPLFARLTIGDTAVASASGIMAAAVLPALIFRLLRAGGFGLRLAVISPPLTHFDSLFIRYAYIFLCSGCDSYGGGLTACRWRVFSVGVDCAEVHRIDGPRNTCV